MAMLSFYLIRTVKCWEVGGGHESVEGDAEGGRNPRQYVLQLSDHCVRRRSVGGGHATVERDAQGITIDVVGHNSLKIRVKPG